LKRKSVIIVAYNFDQDRTASQRPKSWLRFFYNFGYYPIVVTISKKQYIENFLHGEVHRVKAPDLFIERKLSTFFPPLINKIRKKLHQIFIAYSAVDKTTRLLNSYIKENLSKKSDLMIVSGSPFQLFRLGYNYSKLPDKNWVADYRDQWTLSKIPPIGELKLDRIIKRTILRRLEKKWLNSSIFGSHVSKVMANELSELSVKPVEVIENGFYIDEHREKHLFPESGIVSFVYIGALYSVQNIDLTISAIYEGLKRSKTKGKIGFIGTKLNNDILDLIGKIDESILEIRVLSRMSKAECLATQQENHFGIMLNYGIKGVPSSKLYEFIGMQQQVFNYPSDIDIIEKTLTDCNLGYSFSNHENAVDWVADTATKINKGQFVPLKPNQLEIDKFSREKLAEKYCFHLNKHTIN